MSPVNCFIYRAEGTPRTEVDCYNNLIIGTRQFFDIYYGKEYIILPLECRCYVATTLSVPLHFSVTDSSVDA